MILELFGMCSYTHLYLYQSESEQTPLFSGLYYASPSQYQYTHIHTFTHSFKPRPDLKQPVYLPACFLEEIGKPGGKKPMKTWEQAKLCTNSNPNAGSGVGAMRCHRYTLQHHAAQG